MDYLKVINILLIDRLLCAHSVSQWSARPDPQVHPCDRPPLGAASCRPPALLDSCIHRLHCNVFILSQKRYYISALQDNERSKIV